MGAGAADCFPGERASGRGASGEAASGEAVREEAALGEAVWVDVSRLFRSPRSSLRFCGWTETSLDFTPLHGGSAELARESLEGSLLSPGDIVSGVASFCPLRS